MQERHSGETQEMELQKDENKSNKDSTMTTLELGNMEGLGTSS
jgi:hypothetical protein